MPGRVWEEFKEGVEFELGLGDRIGFHSRSDAVWEAEDIKTGRRDCTGLLLEEAWNEEGKTSTYDTGTRFAFALTSLTENFKVSQVTSVISETIHSFCPHSVSSLKHILFFHCSKASRNILTHSYFARKEDQALVRSQRVN